MAAKSVIPLIAGIGAAALFFSRRKKKVTSPENGVVLSGSDSGFEWQVRKVSQPGFAARYFGEVRVPGQSEFMSAHEGGRPRLEEARNLALEFIANFDEAEPVPGVVLSGSDSGFEWRVRKVSQPGFAARYFGEVRAPGQESWTAVHDVGRPNPEEARNLALEFIVGGLG